MANTKGEGKGEAANAEISTTPAGEESQDEHAAHIREGLTAEADALVASAEIAVERQKAHLAGAEKALADAEANRASLEE